LEEGKGRVEKVVASGLRFEDRYDGAMNFSPWKERIALLLE
jgi:hypothetical protein